MCVLMCVPLLQILLPTLQLANVCYLVPADILPIREIDCVRPTVPICFRIPH